MIYIYIMLILCYKNDITILQYIIIYINIMLNISIYIILQMIVPWSPAGPATSWPRLEHVPRPWERPVAAKNLEVSEGIIQVVIFFGVGTYGKIWETIWHIWNHMGNIYKKFKEIYIYNTHRHLGWCFVTFWRFRWFFGARHWYFWILERALVKRDRNAILKCTHVGDPVIKWWIISRHRTGIKLWFHFYFNTLF